MNSSTNEDELNLTRAEVDVERTCLAGILAEGRAGFEACTELRLTSRDFGLVANRAVFDACESLFVEGSEIDWILVRDRLVHANQIDAVGGTLEFERLAATSSAGASAYAPLVVDAAAYRRLEQLSVSGLKMARMRLGSAEDVRAKMEDAVLRVNKRTQDSAAVVDAPATARRVLEAARRGKGTGAIPTGFPDIDRLLRGGMRPGNLIILAARPAMGKTGLGLQIAAGVADEGIPAAFFSFEMTGDELIEREIAGLCRVAVDDWVKSEGGWLRATKAASAVAARPLYRVDSPAMSIAAVTSQVRRLVVRHGVQLVVVDYLGLMKGSGAYAGKKTHEIGEVSNGLKALAMELKIPVVALCQLNRGVEGRQDKRPGLADLRDSGEIEQDANIVMFVHRPEYYMKEKTPGHLQGIAEILVEKNRSGPTGIVQLMFDQRTVRFGSLARADAA